MWSYGCSHDTQWTSFIINEIWSFYRTKLLSRASFLRQVDATVHYLDWQSTIWIDRLRPGPIVCIRDQPSTYEGLQPVTAGTNHLHTKVHNRLYTKVRDQLHTKVSTGYKQRLQLVTYKGLQLITYGKLQLVLYEKVTFCFLKKWTCLFQIDLTTRILQILPIFY